MGEALPAVVPESFGDVGRESRKEQKDSNCRSGAALARITMDDNDVFNVVS